MILDRYLLRQFFPIFFSAIFMFVFLLLLIDLFSSIIRYMNNEVPVLEVLRMSLYFIPKSVSYAMPLSLLFASAYTLGDLYAKNELTTIFSTGIPFWRFCVPLILVGFFASLFSFYLDDKIVIPTMKIKSDLTRKALRQHITENNSDIVIKAKNGKLIYSVDYFDYEELILNGVSIIEQGDDGEFISQIRAHSANWNGERWVFNDAKIYQYENEILRIRNLPANVSYNEHPEIFKRNSVNVQDLKAKDAGLLVKDLREAGLPFQEALSDYYHRFSFSTTSFIVMFLSVSMGCRFRKNILLMSLFTSISVAVVYYITEMLSMTMAGYNYIYPFIGAWFPVFLFIIIGVFLIRGAKT